MFRLKVKLQKRTKTSKLQKCEIKNSKVARKSLVAKFGEGATKSGATLKGIFEKAIGSKKKKKKKEEK